VLTINVFECLMVGMRHKMPRLEVIAIMCHCPRNSIEFLVISVRVASRTIEFLTEVGNGLL